MLKIVLVSSVLPQNATATEVILYRHFSRYSELDLTIVTSNFSSVDSDYKVISITQHLIRFTKTRLSKVVHAVAQFLSIYSYRVIEKELAQKPPDLIVTVAHGDLCWLAQHLAKKFNIPLVTFFHDWWPDLAYVPDWTRPMIENRFRALYQKSQLAFCVSPEMQTALGSHPNAQVLFPIPQSLSVIPPANETAQSQLFTVAYAGNLSEIYASMMQDLAGAVLDLNKIQLKLFGPRPDWTEAQLQIVQEKGLYQGFLSEEQLTKELARADALLVVMSFHPKDRQRMETSFPSKIVNYCHFGKPIIIWGPEYCSAIRWAQKHTAALTITSPLAQDVFQSIYKLACHPEQQVSLAKRARELAQTMFHAEAIQQQFIEALYQTANSNMLN